VLGEKRQTEIAFRQVLAAKFSEDTRLLEVSYLDRGRKRGPLSLIKVTGIAQDSEDDVVSAWTETLMHIIYEGRSISPSSFCSLPSFIGVGIKRGRRLKILINPRGGVVCVL
jgi:sphingosine kinase